MILKEKEAEAAYRDLGEDAKRAGFLEREREIQVRSDYLLPLKSRKSLVFQLQERLVNFKSKFGLHCLGRDRAFRRFWVFDSVPGLFVEHDDGEVRIGFPLKLLQNNAMISTLAFQVGECRPEETPWRPDASGPLTEEQATEKARQIMRVGNDQKYSIG